MRLLEEGVDDRLGLWVQLVMLKVEDLGLILIARVCLGQYMGEEDDFKLVEMELLGHFQQQ